MRHQTQLVEILATIDRSRYLQLSAQTVALSHTFKLGQSNQSLVMYVQKPIYHCREQDAIPYMVTIYG